MSLELELKKNTAALEANTVALNSALPSKPAGDTEAAVVAPNITDTLQPIPNVPAPPVPAPSSVPTPPAPAPAVATGTPLPSSPPPVATIPVAAAAPADDEARQKLVAWAQGELGKIQGVLGPQRMFEMIQAEGVEKLSLISSGRLPQFVVEAQNEAAAIQASVPGVPQ